MDTVSRWFAEILARPIDWELILRFAQALAWPAVTAATLMAVRPGRIIDALLDGGELSAGPAKLKFRNRVQEITKTVEDARDVDASEAGTDTIEIDDEPPATNPLEETADPYTTVINGWGLVTKGLETSTQLAGLPALRKSRPLEAVQQLRDAELIDRRHERGVEELWEFRNTVKTAGSAKAERRGLSQATADEFYSNADKMRRSIITTTKKRLARSKGADSTKPPAPDKSLH